MLRLHVILAASCSTLFLTSQMTFAQLSKTANILNLERGEPVPVQPIDWDTNALDFRERLEQELTFVCPPGGAIGVVWGTDIYTDDSSICSAAVHAGIITSINGGRVTFRIKPGETRYQGTERNSVLSQSFERWEGSFIFVEPSEANTPLIISEDWTDDAINLRDRLDQEFTFNCLPNAQYSLVWGTNIYSDDSSVCTAAVHVGLINPKLGGQVTIRIRPGLDSYASSDRNGVLSLPYGTWGGSFIFVR